MNICAKLNICALNAPTSQSPHRYQQAQDDRHNQKTDNQKRQTISLFLDTNQPDLADTQADPKDLKIFPPHI
jgi:hypothetical protein